MIDCDGIRMQAPLYLSGEMEASDRDEFASHLARCPVCAAKLAEDRTIDAALQSALSGATPDTGPLELAVRQRIAVDSRRRRWAGAAMLAPAAALLAVAGIAWRNWSTPPQSYAAAALDHRKEVAEAQPRHWRTSPSDLAGLAEQNGLELSQAAGMALTGYRLERAKVCTIGGQRMLHLVFSNGARRYSIFVAPDFGRAESSRPVRAGAERVAEFKTGHFRGLVVSDSSATECAELARVAESQL